MKKYKQQLKRIEEMEKKMEKRMEKMQKDWANAISTFHVESNPDQIPVHENNKWR